MPRIAKKDVQHALTVAAKSLVEAGGPDGRVSRADVSAQLPTLQPEHRALVDAFFRFVDQRDWKKGAQVTAKDVERAVTYAKRSMVAKYDLNENGLSQAEIARMSLTGKRAVDLARALKAAAQAELPPRLDEGLSEPEDILAAGQVPRDWVPQAHLERGTIHGDARGFQTVTTPSSLTPELRRLAEAALSVLWERSFQYRLDPEQHTLELGAQREGTLKLGTFRRSDDGKTYLVADWRDIDDASYTLYFEPRAGKAPRLAIEQFNN